MLAFLKSAVAAGTALKPKNQSAMVEWVRENEAFLKACQAGVAASGGKWTSVEAAEGVRDGQGVVCG